MRLTTSSTSKYESSSRSKATIARSRSGSTLISQIPDSPPLNPTIGNRLWHHHRRLSHPDSLVSRIPVIVVSLCNEAQAIRRRYNEVLVHGANMKGRFCGGGCTWFKEVFGELFGASPRDRESKAFTAVSQGQQSHFPSELRNEPAWRPRTYLQARRSKLKLKCLIWVRQE